LTELPQLQMNVHLSSNNSVKRKGDSTHSVLPVVEALFVTFECELYFQIHHCYSGIIIPILSDGQPLLVSNIMTLFGIYTHTYSHKDTSGPRKNDSIKDVKG